MVEVKEHEFDFYKSCVIPYRISQGEIELMLITSIKKKNWIFPKGFIEFNLTPFESAKKEAYEEAGVIGENETVELGWFILKKKNGTSLIKVFSMEVTKEVKDYPEKNLRKRKWFSLKETLEIIDNSDMLKLIGKLTDGIKHLHQNPS